MLNPNGANIYSAGFAEFADLVYDIVVVKAPKGKNVAKLWDKVYNALLILDALADVNYLSDEQANALYSCLSQLLKIYSPSDYPTPLVPPAVILNQGPSGVDGKPGPKGDTGGGRSFNAGTISATRTVDTVLLSEGYAARWDYLVNGTAQRAGTIIATWTEDGANVDFADTSSPDVNGDTSGIEFNVAFSGGQIILQAVVTTGTWAISGTRYLIPEIGTYVHTSSVLSSGKIWVGNSSNVPTERTASGDVTISNTGVTAISSDVIVDADINSSAAITLSKLAPLTASRALVSNGSGVISISSVTSTELGYLSGVTSAIQTQLNGKQATITGAATTITSSNLTASRAIVSNSSGKIAISAVTSTELGYLSGVTSAIQTQLNGKQATITGAASTVTSANLTPSRILASDSGGKIVVTSVSASSLSTITNSGASNELLKSDGTNIVGSGLYSSTNGQYYVSSGNLEFRAGIGSIYLRAAYDVGVSDPDYIRHIFIAPLASGTHSRIHAVKDPAATSPVNFLIEASWGNTSATSSIASGDHIQIKGGEGVNTNGNGGNVILTPGAPAGSGTIGRIIIEDLPTSSPSVTNAVWNHGGYLVQGEPENLSIGGLKMKVIQIGDWNMDSTATKAVAHGLSNYKKIRSISVIVRDDNDSLYHDLLATPVQGTDVGTRSGHIDSIDATNINLRRLAAATYNGWFDGSIYDSTSYNRGWITIIYEV